MLLYGGMRVIPCPTFFKDLQSSQRFKMIDADALEQVVAGLSIIGTGIHQVWRLGKRIGVIEGRMENVVQFLEEYPEVLERLSIMRTRQDYLEREIEALKKYN